VRFSNVAFSDLGELTKLSASISLSANQTRFRAAKDRARTYFQPTRGRSNVLP
jgi:hypothetical protein